MTESKTPSTVLESLLRIEQSDARRKKLVAVNEVCSARFEAGEMDFSIATIGQLCVAKGIFAAKVLRNKDSKTYRDLIGAWECAAAPAPPDLENLSDKHPEVVFRKLLEKRQRSDRAAKLRRVHELCRKHYETGSLDFSLPTIGAICNAAGILATRSLSAPTFADYRQLISSWDDFARPWLGVQAEAGKSAKRVQRSQDFELTWLLRDYPDLEPWHSLATAWLREQNTAGSHKLAALSSFIERFLLHPDVPTAPHELLAKGVQLPNFRDTACAESSTGVAHNNYIRQFLDFVLLKDFSLVQDDGVRAVSPAYRNPLPILSVGDEAPASTETVRSPLPYGYIDELRHLLAQGPNFRDWIFAQTALGSDIGENGGPGRDWFDVSEEMVDRSDPDCVLRTRARKENGQIVNVLQMWSPVRWVAVLTKLQVPLRTTQVRVLDSGEFDTWKYTAGKWAPNGVAMAGHQGVGERHQGVFRRKLELGRTSKECTVLYINTNKTADANKPAREKGYEIPWHVSNELVSNVYYWLEKLRDWQTKYNAVERPTSWSELDGRHISAKTPHQLATYPDTSFLFRLAESNNGERHLPVSDGMVSVAWCNLLAEYQERLAARGEKHADGSAICLVTKTDKGRLKTDFPLHSLRVSLITALALEGEVPFSILSKVVGHSRVLMTLYYIKAGESRTREVLADGEERLRALREKSIVGFLSDMEHSTLLERAVYNSASALSAAVPVHPASRNPAGWMLMHHGCCLVGGNTSELEENSAIGGCYNGGPNIGTAGKTKYAPVPGGSRNCIRCRWFVTEPHYLSALAAHFNTIAYHFDEAWKKCLDYELVLQDLKRTKARMEAAIGGPPFLQFKEFAQAERIWETSVKRYSDLAEDLAACYTLIERCQELLTSPIDGNSTRLVIQGSVQDVELVVEETASELLQLSGVCGSLELYPDLDGGKAILRRTQLLDLALYSEGLPPMFMTLSEKDQLLSGNAFMRKLSALANPQNEFLGERKIVEIIDAGKRLRDAFGIDVDNCLKAALSTSTEPQKVIPIAVVE